MNCEMTVHAGENEFKIFMQNGFFEFGFVTPTLHRHRYPEIHVVAHGTAEFAIGGNNTVFSASEAFAVPAGVFHKCASCSDDVLHVAFQTDMPIKEPARVRLPAGAAEALLLKIKNKDVTVSAYAAAVCGEFLLKKTAQYVPITDRGFLIDEFFANGYDKDVTLSSLAAELGLSEKQSARLVKKYTGNTFRDELAKRRIDAAKRLESEGKLSLSEIASRVGYKSYSGFWKAHSEN